MIQTADRLDTINEYYFSIKLREVRGLMAEGRPIISMGIGSPDLAPKQEVLDALTNSLHDDLAHQYQSYQGLPELRQGFADFYKKYYNVSFSIDNEILPLMGSKEGIMHVSMAFLNPGDEALIPNPGYPTYTSVTNLVGAVPKYYDLTEANGWYPDFDALEQMDVSKVKIMWVNYPHMPTGASGDLGVYERLVAFCKKNNILLVNDNPYSFVLTKKPMSVFQIPEAKEVALELNSLSKSFNMAGWRVGMIVGNPALINAVLKVKSNMDSGMFYGIQKGAVEALKNEQDWFDDLNEVYNRRRELIYQLVHKLGLTYDKNAVGMFVWAKLPNNGVSAEEFIDKVLYEKNIFIVPGTVFGSNGQGYVRFSLCVKEDKIIEAIKRFN
ncbi:MAG: aminotransferase class I/II-fold pyridoxal phosphate-dependent enzyme [Flavobacteriales bacterium]|nr:aminotransferase class I/II-fold pyridoxal phosphate-dependent enzyme [Flavobacteriales bacterium]